MHKISTTKATKEPGIQHIEEFKRLCYRVQIRFKGSILLFKNSGLPYEIKEMHGSTVDDLIDRFIKDDLKKLRNHRTIIGYLQW